MQANDCRSVSGSNRRTKTNEEGIMSNKEKFLKAVAHGFAGITVEQFNKMFAGMSEEAITRYMILVCAERKQFGDENLW